jgi:hypothetical protein
MTWARRREVLEFYSANIADPALTFVRATHPLTSIAQRFDVHAMRSATPSEARTMRDPAAAHARAILCAIGVAIMLGACAPAPLGPQSPAMPPAAPPLPRNAEPPPPSFNLSGFPLPYRQGYADGCASVAGAERKDATRFAGDPNYRTGWQDGLALCRRK